MTYLNSLIINYNLSLFKIYNLYCINIVYLKKKLKITKYVVILNLVKIFKKKN